MTQLGGSLCRANLEAASLRLNNEQIQCIKYLVIYSRGGLGNQLFQFISARCAAPLAQIICIGMDHLNDCLVSSAARKHTFCSIQMKKVFARIGRQRAINFACRFKTYGYLGELRSADATRLVYRPGFIKHVAVTDAYFQSENLTLRAGAQDMCLRPEIVSNARQWLATNIGKVNRTPYFVHVRRGDYIRWPSAEFPAVLPFRWYETQMSNILQLDPSAHFIVCSDDLPYVRELFARIERATIFSGSQIEDFAVMSQCAGGGILSASTFAWWAAWFGRQNAPKARYIAPKYWGGWRNKRWYPLGLNTSWLEYADA